MDYRKVHHIGIAVDDLDQMVTVFTQSMGLKCDRVVEYPEFNVRVAFFPVGETLIELVQGTVPSNEISRTVKQFGNVLHHICLEVDDIDAALDQLASRDVQLKDRVARKLDEDTRFAFVDPSSTGGMTFELYQTAKTAEQKGEVR